MSSCPGTGGSLSDGQVLQSDAAGDEVYQQLDRLKAALTAIARLPAYRVLRGLGSSRGAGATDDQFVYSD